MVDVPYLRKTLEHITAHPEEWDQRHYGIKKEGCGTAYCVAGLVAHWEGYTFIWGVHDEMGVKVARAAVSPRRTVYGVEAVARGALGLTPRQASNLFWMDNDLARLWTLASIYTDGEIEIPEEFREQ